MVREIDTDYLVIGAGASALAFVDAMLAGSDARVVLVDRRHRPGGHWLDAYPFVRLHQPSAYYGVASRRLGEDRIDDTGPNAGFYERATAQEICDYFNHVLEADLSGSGRVRFLGMSNYRGEDADGHRVTSLLTGNDTVIRARKLVDATYVASDIPSRHTPEFAVDPGVHVIPPNDLVNLSETPRQFTVLGAGKTAMDTCNWLIDAGVDPDRIQWVRPRDAWLFNRSFMQPLELVAQYMEMQASWVHAAAEATGSADFAHRLEADDVFLRLDPDVEPETFRGATISTGEVEQLRSIERVVRKGRVRSISSRRVVLDGGELDAAPGDVYVDCTAAGVPATKPQPVFAPDRITLQYTTIGIVPYGAATIGTVEVKRDADTEKNRLCPPVVFTGRAADVLRIAYVGMSGMAARSAEPDLEAWNTNCRLNPARGAGERASDPRMAAAFTRLMTYYGAAMHNLAARAGTIPTQPVAATPVGT
jgi:hypothetical protein